MQKIIVATGLAIPFIITHNLGFTQMRAIPCGLNDLVHNALEPVTDLLLEDEWIRNCLIAVSSALIDF